MLSPYQKGARGPDCNLRNDEFFSPRVPMAVWVLAFMGDFMTPMAVFIGAFMTPVAVFIGFFIARMAACFIGFLA